MSHTTERIESQDEQLRERRFDEKIAAWQIRCDVKRENGWCATTNEFA